MIEVTAGILTDGGRILVCQRRAGESFGLKWEFPGGDVSLDKGRLAAGFGTLVGSFNFVGPFALMLLGAKMVLVGRATLYGTACGGQAGAARAIKILSDEMKRSFGYVGARSVAEIGPHIFAHPDSARPRSARVASVTAREPALESA